ncbi:MAG: bifunctional pyr operon transcriptional regulator/uracil phosphoribosyltransferase PyrR [Bacteroidia bacterium]|jgi:pyrimidine operon attenuation protein/uracil phosphoribosyltransferase|nr:bifunctional pyr operon transcriptional regulator/uracil phosphoribosyltransferase PyrR [Bacteroidia bacterium]MCC6769453.1 bifunctional pyr operon transcriptional regulator/uracil phosphoribosyltransferase PyrR [Bacteroidia bacterium]
MPPRLILDSARFSITIRRLCFQLIENHDNFSNSVLIGLQPRGILLARCIREELNKLTGNNIAYGELDTTFFRDDFRMKALVPNTTQMECPIENRNVILIDDVLFTGRSVRAAMDALQQFGRPNHVELLVLVNRRFSRHVPVQPDYVGLTVDALFSEKVIVQWAGDMNTAAITLTSAESNDRS